MTHDLVKNKMYSNTLRALYMRNYRQNNPKYGKKEYARVKVYRVQLMEILGGCSCVDCGYDESIFALQIDHIEAHGSDDVRRFKNRVQMYKYYIDNPTIAIIKLQVLCANCNMIKMHKNKEWLISKTRGKSN